MFPTSRGKTKSSYSIKVAVLPAAAVVVVVVTIVGVLCKVVAEEVVVAA